MHFLNEFCVANAVHLQITMTASTIGATTGVLVGQPGACMPRQLVVRPGNAAGEGKHQTAVRFCA